LAIDVTGLVGTGGNGPHSHFLVHRPQNQAVAEGMQISLESKTHKGHHVGIQTDGEVKPAHNTGTGPAGTFTVHFA